MKKIILMASVLLGTTFAYAQKTELGVKIGGFANYDPAFVNGIVPMTGISVLFRPHNGMLQLGPVAELGIDDGDFVGTLGMDLNVPIGIRKIGYVYPGVDIRLMNAYSDFAFSAGVHGGINFQLTKHMSLNAEAGPRLISFNALPRNGYLVGSGTIGLRFNM